MTKRQTVNMVYSLGRRCMVEGILQGYDSLSLSEYDVEYDGYVEDIMEGVAKGLFSNLDEFTNFLSNMGGLELDTNLLCLAELSRMIWRIIQHNVKED